MVRDIQDRQRKQEERFSKIAAVAAEQGLVIVQLSPRKFVLIRRNPGNGFYGITRPNGEWGYFTYETGEAIYIGSFRETREHLATLIQPLPSDLTNHSF